MAQPMTHVFVLSYKRQKPDGAWEGQFIGVYSSMEQVEAAQARLQPRLAFRDYPQGFYVDCWLLDQDYDGQDFFWMEPPRPAV
jgi:hypothetical protein